MSDKQDSSLRENRQWNIGVRGRVVLAALLIVLLFAGRHFLFNNDDPPATEYEMARSVPNSPDSTKKTANEEESPKDSSRRDYVLGVMFENGIDVEKNIDTARFFYFNAFSKGTQAGRDAFLRLGDGPRTAPPGQFSPNPFLRTSTLKKRADDGEANAQYLLALLYEYQLAQIVDLKDLGRTMELLEKAASQGHLLSMIELSNIYAVGDLGIPADQVLAFKWTKEAADRGSVRAKSSLSLRYEIGLGVEKDISKAFALAKESAEAGDLRGRDLFASALVNGNRGPSEVREGMRLLKECAEAGSSSCMHDIGVSYAKGAGTQKDFFEARKWFERVSEIGYPPAQHALAYMLINGQGGDVDISRAKLLLEKADFPPAYITLGNMFFKGEGVPKDLSAAIGYFRKAARNDDLDGIYNLAGALREKNEKNDLCEARGRLSTAAAKGMAPAQYLLGVMTERGECGPPNLVEARSWYQKAALQGHATAQFNLGLMTKMGTGGDKDLRAARDWYQKAADQGEPAAQNNLGGMLWNGEGGPEDRELALDWFKRSAVQGNEDAQRNLAEQVAKLARLVETIERAGREADFPDINEAVSALSEGDRYSQSQQELIFSQKYEGKRFLVKGTIADIRETLFGKDLVVNVGPDHYFSVAPAADFNLLDYAKGQQVAFVGTWTSYGMDLSFGKILHKIIDAEKPEHMRKTARENLLKHAIRSGGDLEAIIRNAILEDLLEDEYCEFYAPGARALQADFNKDGTDDFLMTYSIAGCGRGNRGAQKLLTVLRLPTGQFKGYKQDSIGSGKWQYPVYKFSNGSLHCTVTEVSPGSNDAGEIVESASYRWAVNSWKTPVLTQPLPTRDKTSTSSSIAINEAEAALKRLYEDLSDKDWAAVREIVDEQTQKSVFPEQFYSKLQSVSIGNIQITSSDPDKVEAEAETLFDFEDGTSQSEKRSFTLAQVDGRIKVTSSRFVKVLRERERTSERQTASNGKLATPMAVPEDRIANEGQYELLVHTTVMSEPSYTAPAIQELPSGTKINVIGQSGSWLKVRSRAGQIGYVKSQDATSNQ